MPLIRIMVDHNLGRGEQAAADMKARIAAIRSHGLDVVDVLWERNRRAQLGEGYVYEFAREAADEV